jgi:DNA-binding NtrC family response regulator
VRLLGHGRNAGLNGVAPNHEEPGLLRSTAGGTLFIDELHSLDRATLEFLRRPMDRGPMHPAVGQGDTFTPNVRFIFATYHSLDVLLNEEVLPTDFYRRLGGRTLEVPPLNQRKEDIPLFFERFRNGRRHRSSFLLALLLHDWHGGQVDELLRAIRDAISRRCEGEAVTAEDLRGLLPTCVLDYVSSLTEEVMEREVYSWMRGILRAQGFESERELRERMAELLGVSATTVWRRLRELDQSASGDGGHGAADSVA